VSRNFLASFADEVVDVDEVVECVVGAMVGRVVGGGWCVGEH